MYGRCLKCGHIWKLKSSPAKRCPIQGCRTRSGRRPRKVETISNEEAAKIRASREVTGRIVNKPMKPIKKPVEVSDVPEDKPGTKMDEIIKKRRDDEEQEEFWKELDPELCGKFYKDRIRTAKSSGMSRSEIVDYIIEQYGKPKEIAVKIVDFLWKSQVGR